MKNVLYTKYNSTRKPEYQLSTSIIEENGTKYVVKKAIQSKAKEHLLSLPEKREKLVHIYKDMDIVSCEIVDEEIVFPFVEGKSLLRDVNFKEEDIDAIVEKVKTALQKVSQYAEDCYCPFEITEEFRDTFGYYFDDKEIQAVCPANLDGILGNFLEQPDGRLCSIDYEWIVDFPVPIRFLDYRAIFYLYTENEKYLKHKISRVEFLEKFGFSESEHNLFFAMELNFQQEVCGKGMCYTYPDKYLKRTVTRAELVEAHTVLPLEKQAYEQLEEEFKYSLKLVRGLEDRGEEIRKLKRRVANAFRTLDEQQNYINELKCMIKNPFYAVSSVLGKKNRVVISSPEDRLDETVLDEKTAAYREKYVYVRDSYKVDSSIYDKWINQREKKERYDDIFEINPKISVIVLVDNVLENAIRTSVQSVCNQIYENWELCVLVNEQDKEIITNIVSKYVPEEKLKVVLHGEELGKTSGEYITYVKCGDMLRVNALYEVIKEMNTNPNVDLIYSDEDEAMANGRYRHNPFFKPGWSPDTLLSFWYTGHLAVYRRTIATEIGGLNADFAEGKEYDFILRFTEKTQNVSHIEKILYHRIGKEKMSSGVATKVQNEAIRRRGLSARLEFVAEVDQNRVVYSAENQPLVSIVIPSKDNYDILKVCIDSLKKHTTYKNYEIVLVDNGSCAENKEKYQKLCDTHDMTYIYQEMKFNFSKMCNIGATASNGEYFVFLNDDIEIIQPDWLDRMVGHASQSHTGAVGAKLLYPNSDLIQHIGVVMYNDGPAHALTKYSDKNNYSFGRNKTEYNWLAVTAACMVVKADKYREVGGFNENLMVAFNDVDFCFKLLKAGYYNVVRNDVILYHHESISRGNDHLDAIKLARSQGEFEVLKAFHPAFAEHDKFYNVNLIPNNVSFECDFTDYVPQKQVINTVSKANMDVKNFEELMCSIDVVEEREDNIYVCGWAIIPGRLDNNDQEWNVLLKGHDTSYMVDTDKDYRPDVADAYLNELLIEFVGFKCTFKKDMLESGEYQLGVVGEDGCKMVEKRMIIL